MKVRAVLGLIAALLLILSSGAHSILGWQGMSAQLALTNANPELVSGLKMGWHFGGVVMLALGIIFVLLFGKLYRGEDVATYPAAVIAVAYLAFGIWAMVSSGFNPFFLVFLVPGLLLALASTRVKS